MRGSQINTRPSRSNLKKERIISKITGELRRLRGLASPLDHETEALRPAPPLPFTLHIDATGAPADERAETLGHLIGWCVEKGYDPAPAIGFAMHHAAGLWLKRYKLDTPPAIEANARMCASSLANLKGIACSGLTGEAFRIAAQVTDLWTQNDRPFEGEGCAEAQRQILMHVARKAR